MQTFVVADPSEESVEVTRRPARLTFVQIGANQQVGAGKRSVIEHEQSDCRGSIRGGRRTGKQHRMDLVRMAARDASGIEWRRLAVPAPRLEPLNGQARLLGDR